MTGYANLKTEITIRQINQVINFPTTHFNRIFLIDVYNHFAFSPHIVFENYLCYM